jgi:hypothetical protein
MSSAFGLLQSLATVSPAPPWAQARRRAGRSWGLGGLPSLREGALRCSVSWPVAELSEGKLPEPRRRTALGPSAMGH